ncbi:MAG: aldehyde dehydrogenase family protein [Verrucomicrobiota bacterium]|jgi:acyl-CoA reductase-like NAD-dependent aldehyde dehydrogenase
MKIKCFKTSIRRAHEFVWFYHHQPGHWEADWYAEHGPQMLADAPAPTGRVEAYVSYLPLGPILGIMPWNFPMWQVTRMGIPTLLASNVLLVKHSPNTQRSSLELERVMLEASLD